MKSGPHMCSLALLPLTLCSVSNVSSVNNGLRQILRRWVVECVFMVKCIIISHLPTKPWHAYVYCRVMKVYMAVAPGWEEFTNLRKRYLPFVWVFSFYLWQGKAYLQQTWMWMNNWILFLLFCSFFQFFLEFVFLVLFFFSYVGIL